VRVIHGCTVLEEHWNQFNEFRELYAWHVRDYNYSVQYASDVVSNITQVESLSKKLIYLKVAQDSASYASAMCYVFLLTMLNFLVNLSGTLTTYEQRSLEIME